jgi:hypothetical protein
MIFYTTESLRKYVGNIGSVLKELSLSKNSDHAYKAKEALDSLVKREGGMEKLLNSSLIYTALSPVSEFEIEPHHSCHFL